MSYRDTEYRLINDGPFRLVVDQLAAIALEQGFTPGELKQIAFAAALKVEMTSTLPSRFRAEKKGEEEEG